MTASAAGLKAGDRVLLVRPSTSEWIASLGMNDFGGGLDYTGWKAGDIDIRWMRTVVSAAGGRLTLDAPVSCHIAPTDGAYLLKVNDADGEVRECGIENLTLVAETGSDNAMDEDHAWDGVWMNHVRDCWVRRVSFRHLAGSAVNLQRQTSRITVEDCLAEEPVSEIGGWRRTVFLTRGTQTLFQRCVSREGIHDFAADALAAGPNAFVQCDAENSCGFSGSVGSWATGLLFDVVNIDGGDLKLADLNQFRCGTGWNAAASMCWQSTASTVWCYSPDTLNRNSGHACWGTLTGNGEWTESNNHVSPRSLFYDQLLRRVPETPVKGWLMPIDGEASSSPTPDQAMALARQSLTRPRLTLEMWADSIPFTASVSEKGCKRIAAPHKSDKQENSRAFAITDGVITVDGALLTGRRYAIPWWNGRVKDNWTRREARPAVTRFVPGREGTGWTDRPDSVVLMMQKGHYAALDHHYGLWYDLRRTDHERVRRATGEVWAPFYEQPFARCGEGKAWDGLSKYDLTRPNRWYWKRLSDFAEGGEQAGYLLFQQHYFQHNILEAGAHWADCPWRTANNVNQTSFPEPVPYAGDKRIFMAEQFYNENDAALRPLHEGYIRMCLDQLEDRPNVVHFLSAEYTGPLHFTRFWLGTIARWAAEKGRHPLVALSCTKDAQDSILADGTYSKTVDIIDIRYWHYNTQGLWAAEAGKNMAPRQWTRKMKVGKTGFEEVYRAVREYRQRYPDKAVIYSAQGASNGWAVLMAGGSLPEVTLSDAALLRAIPRMRPIDADGGYALGGDEGYLIYTPGGKTTVKVAQGSYQTLRLEGGKMETVTMKPAKIAGQITLEKGIYWLKKGK